MKEVSGMCRFCGQEVLVVVPDDATAEMVMEEASRNCRCKESLAYMDEVQKREAIEAAKQSAKGTTYELFHDEYPEIEEIFNNSMDDLVNKRFKKITISTGGRTKATMTFAKDTIKVEREDKSVSTRETEL